MVVVSDSNYILYTNKKQENYSPALLYLRILSLKSKRSYSFSEMITKLQSSDLIVTGSLWLTELEMIASVLFKKLDNDVLIMKILLKIALAIIAVPLLSNL